MCVCVRVYVCVCKILKIEQKGAKWVDSSGMAVGVYGET